MCYFMFGITDMELTPSTINENEQIGLIISNETELVKDRKPSNFYYNISNGNCACDIVVSPFDKVSEVKKVFLDMNSKNSFRFVILDSHYEEGFLQFDENANFENILSSLPKMELNLKELLDKYPNYIAHDTVYLVK